MNKTLDYIFPVTGAASGSYLVISILETAVTAIVFALIGGLVGFLLKKALDYIWPKLIKIFKK